MGLLSTVDAFKHMQSPDCLILNDEQLQQLQNTVLGILADITAFCRENKINFSLGGGSALGAVRHGGFIPWDDDIDLNMPSKDYFAFCDGFGRRYKDKYWLHTPEKTQDYNLLLRRVRLKGTCVITREDFFSDESGAFVDIFVVENTFDRPLARFAHGVACMAAGFLHSCRKFYRERKFIMPLAAGNRRLTAVFRAKVAIGFCLSFLSMGRCTHMACAVYRMCRDENSRFVCIPAGRKHFFGEIYNREDICRTVTGKFEKLNVPLPAGRHTYLTRLYGDYMTPPPRHDREKHIFFRPFRL